MSASELDPLYMLFYFVKATSCASYSKALTPFKMMRMLDGFECNPKLHLSGLTFDTETSAQQAYTPGAESLDLVSAPSLIKPVLSL